MLFQLGLEAAELSCFEFETEQGSVHALEDRAIRYCCNAALENSILLEIAKCTARPPQDSKISLLGSHTRCTRALLRRRPASSTCWHYLDYFDYSSRLVKLSRAATTSSITSPIHLRLVDFSNNRRGSITDCHGFVDSHPQIKLSHLFQ
jgi:hypothetical protein